MSETHTLLSVNIWTDVISLDGVKIRQEVMDLGEPVDSEYVESYGETHHHTYYEDLVLKDTPLMRSLQEHIVSTVDGALHIKHKLTAMWGLVLQQGESVQPHSHRSSDQHDPSQYYSVAYYPTAEPGDAQLVFSVQHGNLIESCRHVAPASGKIVIFPSYLNHWTTRQLLDKPRVVVSANLEPVDPSPVSFQDWTAYNLR